MATPTDKFITVAEKVIRFAIYMSFMATYIFNFIEMEKKPPCDHTHSLQHTEGHIYCTRHTAQHTHIGTHTQGHAYCSTYTLPNHIAKPHCHDYFDHITTCLTHNIPHSLSRLLTTCLACYLSRFHFCSRWLPLLLPCSQHAPLLTTCLTRSLATSLALALARSPSPLLPRLQPGLLASSLTLTLLLAPSLALSLAPLLSLSLAPSLLSG